MDTDTLVSELIDAGQRLIEQLPQEGFGVASAFWLKAGEDSRWRLYIVSPVVESEGGTRAYRRLHQVIREMPQPFWIDPLEIRLLEPTDPMAQDLLAILRRYPHPHVCPTILGARMVGNISIEEAYLYPQPVISENKV